MNKFDVDGTVIEAGSYEVDKYTLKFYNQRGELSHTYAPATWKVVKKVEAPALPVEKWVDVTEECDISESWPGGHPAVKHQGEYIRTAEGDYQVRKVHCQDLWKVGTPDHAFIIEKRVNGTHL